MVRSVIASSSERTQKAEWKKGNTRVISQTALDHFRTALTAQKADPYSVLLRRNKLPMGLVEDESKSGGKVSGDMTPSKTKADISQATTHS